MPGMSQSEMINRCTPLRIHSRASSPLLAASTTWPACTRGFLEQFQRDVAVVDDQDAHGESLGWSSPWLRTRQARPRISGTACRHCRPRLAPQATRERCCRRRCPGALQAILQLDCRLLQPHRGEARASPLSECTRFSTSVAIGCRRSPRFDFGNGLPTSRSSNRFHSLAASAVIAHAAFEQRVDVADVARH